MNGRRALVASAVAVACGGAMVIGAARDPGRALAAYLPAFVSCITAASGALLVRAIGHVSGARFLEELRPSAERLSRALLLLSLLLLPVLLGARHLYPWAGAPLPGAPPLPLSPHKAAYLRPGFFALRGALCLGVWLSVDVALRRLARQARTSPEQAGKLRAASALSLPPLAFSISIAAVDWVMSLEPGFVSTGYGLRFVVSSTLAALAAVAVLAPRESGERAGVMPWASLGKLLLCFVMLWAYLAYAQLVVVWLGNLPREAGWYLRRVEGGWGLFASALFAGHFALPFLALLPHGPKRRPAFLAAVGALLLLFHHLESIWLVAPATAPGGPRLGLLDLAALAGVLSLLVAFDALFPRGSVPSRQARRPAASPAPVVGLRHEDA